ncbi:5-carboxymethyl-2-hydroxymuconate Delta-isomerase [Deinococcus sp. YIM 134068]|uniref:5-carboxymethyl-2-hydroxymuconate Delta-isomerase n=1 Tax=Deinococcus lichenicola TaxID=3118910 RepID=UPI002F955729
MPHVIIEYTDNLTGETDIPTLLEVIHAVLMRHGDVFPVGGIRSRAVALHDYRVADGREDDAFVHVTLKIGAGRGDEVKRAVGDELFGVVGAHFAEVFARRYLALSMELQEFGEAGTYKHNNIHARFRKLQKIDDHDSPTNSPTAETEC